MKISPVDAMAGCRAYIEAQGGLFHLEGRHRPFVTISREAGAGGVTVAQLIAERLNRIADREKTPPWTVFDRNLVEKVLTEHDLPQALQRFMPEDVTPDLKDAVEELLGLHPSSWTLVEHTTQTILNLARLGHVILVGRGANIIAAKLPQGIHARLVAPREVRVRHIGTLHDMDIETASHFVKETDRARRRYVQRYFNSNLVDPLNYHFTLNTGRLGHEMAAEVISEAVLAISRAAGGSSSEVPKDRSAWGEKQW